MLTATAGGFAALFLLTNLADLVVWAIAMGRIAWRDSVTWKHGWWSRLGWMLVASIITWTPTPGLVVPLGALAALYRTRRQPAPPEPDPVPMAGSSSSGPSGLFGLGEDDPS